MSSVRVRSVGERVSPARIVAALVGIIALVVSSLLVLPGTSWAAPNPGIVVGEVTVSSENGGQATIGDTLTLAGTWDASAADPQEGDEFTIGLPPELAFPSAVPFNLSGADGTVWATCLTDPATGVATCTLTAAVTENPELVKGEFAVDIEAVQATEETEVVFDLNGVDTLVVLPGGGGIDDGIELPSDWTKSGVMNSDKWSMSWTIELPGARMAGQDVINILDDLSDAHVLCTPSELKVETVRGNEIVDVTTIATIDEDVAAPHDFGIELTAPDGGFNPDVTYRITYDTCTPDGQIDPQGTEYTNDATIDVWGESSGEIGVVQDWNLDGAVSKSGNVLGGQNRNGVIDWMVEVSGDHLLGKDGFTFGDALSGEHELCTVEGNPVVQGLSIYEKYGPSHSQIRTIPAAELARTTTAATATSFTVEFDIADADFEFKPSNHIYVVHYQTCASTDGLPAGGTEFTNQANVDGEIGGTTATTPGRTDRKAGSINTAAVTIDGVAYLPQTTMSWQITVPGERLADVDSALTVTDTLSGTHQVCGAGDDIGARLGLKVEARDQISGGGLATVDLTGGTTASLDGQDLEFVIDEPTLPLPGGAKVTGFSHEYQYVITYTTCTTSGGMDAPGTSYGNNATAAGKNYTSTITQSNKGSGTGEGVPRGSISIDKTLADTTAADLIPADAAFTVHVKEIDPSGTVQVKYDLAVPLNGDPVSGPNSRGTGWTVELSEPTFPTIPGVTFSAPKFFESEGVVPSADGTTAIAQLTPGSNIGVALENTAELGALSVVKELTGGAAGLVAAGTEYEVTATIDTGALGAGFPAQADREIAITTGEPVTLSDLPIGSTVSFSEVKPVDTDLLTWSEPTISPESIVVTPAHATDPATITVTNQVERTVGTFDIVKQVTGAQADNPAVPDTVEVTATWDEEGVSGEKTLIVPTDGTPVPLNEQLLIGTPVALTETPLANGSSINWGEPTWSGTGITIGDDGSATATIGRNADARIVLENHAATSTADISLLKQIGGEAAEAVDSETAFTVLATWDLGDGEVSKKIEINTTSPTPLGEDLPAGTVITLTEIDRPAIDGVDWGTIVIDGDRVEQVGDGSARITVSNQQGTVGLVTVTNEATWSPGTFTVSKQVTGVALNHADVPESVTVQATWFDGAEEQSKDLEVPTDGTPVPFGEDLPYATQVVLTESDPGNSDSFTWASPEWSGDEQLVAAEDGSAVVTIGAALNTEVSLTNHADATLGELSITKLLTGDGAKGVTDGLEFPVTATWSDLLGEQQTRELTVSSGSKTVLESLPFGTEVTLVEGDASASGDVHWVSAEWATDDDAVTLSPDGTTAVITVTGTTGDQVSATLTNEYEQGPALATTGGAISAGVLGLGALLVAGGVWLVLRRRTA